MHDAMACVVQFECLPWSDALSSCASDYLLVSGQGHFSPTRVLSSMNWLIRPLMQCSLRSNQSTQICGARCLLHLTRLMLASLFGSASLTISRTDSLKNLRLTRSNSGDKRVFVPLAVSHSDMMPCMCDVRVSYIHDPAYMVAAENRGGMLCFVV